MNPNSYHIGYVSAERVRFVELDKCKEYQKLYNASLHPLQNVDNFTMLFDRQSLLNYLSSQNLVADFEELHLYIKGKYLGNITVREVSGGIAYQSVKPFFNPLYIKMFYNENIDETLFLSSAIDFYRHYLNNVEMSDNHPFRYQISLLILLKEFLETPHHTPPKVLAKEKRRLIREALNALSFMNDFITYQRKDGKFIYEDGTTAKKTNYKGFRDIAMWSFNTNELLKEQLLEKKETMKEYKEFEKKEQNPVYNPKPFTAGDHNRKFDEYLTDDETNEMIGEGLKRL